MKIRIDHLICPWCGGEVELDYDPTENYPAYLYECCHCGGTFRNTKEQLDQFVRDMEKEKRMHSSSNRSSSYVQKTAPRYNHSDVYCPECGSPNVTVYNDGSCTCQDCEFPFHVDYL